MKWNETKRSETKLSITTQYKQWLSKMSNGNAWKHWIWICGMLLASLPSSPRCFCNLFTDFSKVRPCLKSKGSWKIITIINKVKQQKTQRETKKKGKWHREDSAACAQVGLCFMFTIPGIFICVQILNFYLFCPHFSNYVAVVGGRVSARTLTFTRMQPTESTPCGYMTWNEVWLFPY